MATASVCPARGITAGEVDLERTLIAPGRDGNRRDSRLPADVDFHLQRARRRGAAFEHERKQRGSLLAFVRAAGRDDRAHPNEHPHRLHGPVTEPTDGDGSRRP
jgi:hypothetical protein